MVSEFLLQLLLLCKMDFNGMLFLEWKQRQMLIPSKLHLFLLCVIDGKQSLLCRLLASFHCVAASSNGTLVGYYTAKGSTFTLWKPLSFFLSKFYQEEQDQDIPTATGYRQFCGIRNNFNLNFFAHGSACGCYLQDMLDYLNNDLDDCRSEAGQWLKALSLCLRLLSSLGSMLRYALSF